MQCREVRDLLDSFLGQELMVETNHELMRHLETCVDCRAELEARRELRTVLRRAFANTGALEARPGFAAEALARVRATPRKRATWSSVPAWGAIAASVVLVTAVGCLVVGNRVTVLVRDAVGDHRNCAVKFALAERPISLAEAAARYDPIYTRLEDTPPDDFMTAAGPLHVLERHSCIFAGRRFGHVVLKLEDHLVSLLVTADAHGSGSNSSPGVLSSIPRVDGQHVTSFNTPGHVVFVVSDLPDDQFRSVAQALTMPVSLRLAMLWNIPGGVGD